MKLARCMALAVLALSACAEQATYPATQQGGMGGRGMGGTGMGSGPGGGHPGMRGDMGPVVWRANPNFPNVDVINDTHIVVDQEPIFIPRNFTDKIHAESRYWRGAAPACWGRCCSTRSWPIHSRRRRG